MCTRERGPPSTFKKAQSESSHQIFRLRLTRGTDQARQSAQFSARANERCRTLQGRIALQLGAGSSDGEALSLAVERGKGEPVDIDANRQIFDVFEVWRGGQSRTLLVKGARYRTTVSLYGVETVDIISETKRGNLKQVCWITSEFEPELVHTKDQLGRTALHWAAQRTKRDSAILETAQETTQLVNALLDARAVVDAQDCRGHTPLHLASNDGNFEAAELLLTHRANLLAMDMDGHTPLKLAKEARQEQLVDLLKQAYKFNQDAKDGRRPSGLESFSYQYPDPEI